MSRAISHLILLSCSPDEEVQNQGTRVLFEAGGHGRSGRVLHIPSPVHNGRRRLLPRVQVCLSIALLPSHTLLSINNQKSFEVVKILYDKLLDLTGKVQ